MGREHALERARPKERKQGFLTVCVGGGGDEKEIETEGQTGGKTGRESSKGSGSRGHVPKL